MKDFQDCLGEELSKQGYYGCESGERDAKTFRAGAKFGHEWASNKGVGYLTEWMKSVKAKRVEKLESVIRFCAGIISTMPDYCEMHPEAVEQYLYDEHKKITEL